MQFTHHCEMAIAMTDLFDRSAGKQTPTRAPLRRNVSCASPQGARDGLRRLSAGLFAVRAARRARCRARAAGLSPAANLRLANLAGTEMPGLWFDQVDHSSRRRRLASLMARPPAWRSAGACHCVSSPRSSAIPCAGLTGPCFRHAGRSRWDMLWLPRWWRTGW